jgi:hypothetical protein
MKQCDAQDPTTSPGDISQRDVHGMAAQVAKQLPLLATCPKPNVRVPTYRTPAPQPAIFPASGLG